MESGRTYTENEMEDIEFLEEEIKTIFYKDDIPGHLAKIGTRMINKWKQLVNWKEDTTPFLKKDREKEQRDIQELFNKPKTNT